MSAAPLPIVFPLPIVCAWCERVRTLAGRWEETGAPPVADEATHGICPECLVAQQRELGSAAGIG